MQRSLRRLGAWAGFLPVLASSVAWASVVTTPATLNVNLWENGTWQWREQPQITATAGDDFTVPDGSHSSDTSVVSWRDVTVNHDPFISASVDITNNTLAVQTYTLIFTLPISPAIPGGTLMGGSTQGGITDANFSLPGILGTAPGSAMYYGQIDGVSVLPLLPDVTTVNALFAGGSNSTSASAGLPGPTIPGPAAISTIGIMHKFTLTPGDKATFTSFFVVTPEPGSLALLGLGALVLRRRR